MPSATDFNPLAYPYPVFIDWANGQEPPSPNQYQAPGSSENPYATHLRWIDEVKDNPLYQAKVQALKDAGDYDRNIKAQEYGLRLRQVEATEKQLRRQGRVDKARVWGEKQRIELLAEAQAWDRERFTREQAQTAQLKHGDQYLSALDLQSRLGGPANWGNFLAASEGVGRMFGPGSQYGGPQFLRDLSTTGQSQAASVESPMAGGPNLWGGARSIGSLIGFQGNGAAGDGSGGGFLSDAQKNYARDEGFAHSIFQNPGGLGAQALEKLSKSQLQYLTGIGKGLGYDTQTFEDKYARSRLGQ
ncbi:MAG: hypothetical protein ACRDGM_18145 [bacterium]